MRVGLISDTHGLMRPEALAALQGVDQILHAGDIGGPEVLAALARVAPVRAVRGNNDHGPWADALPEQDVVELAGERVLVLHDLKQLDRAAVSSGYAAIVTGHSHRPTIIERDGVLFVNPGSAGPRRFSLPVAVGFLDLGSGPARARIQPIL